MELMTLRSTRRSIVRRARGRSVSLAAASLLVLLVPAAGARQPVVPNVSFISVDEPWRDPLELGDGVSMQRRGTKKIVIDDLNDNNPVANEAVVARPNSAHRREAKARVVVFDPAQPLPPGAPTPYAGGIAAGDDDAFPSDGEILAGGWRPFFKVVRTTTIAPSSVIAATLDEQDGVVTIHLRASEHLEALPPDSPEREQWKAWVWADNNPQEFVRLDVGELVELRRTGVDAQGKPVWSFTRDAAGQIIVFPPTTQTRIDSVRAIRRYDAKTLRQKH
jgi:hypothetical protein